MLLLLCHFSGGKWPEYSAVDCSDDDDDVVDDDRLGMMVFQRAWVAGPSFVVDLKEMQIKERLDREEEDKEEEEEEEEEEDKKEGKKTERRERIEWEVNWG